MLTYIKMVSLLNTLLVNFISWIVLLGTTPIFIAYRFIVDALLKIKFGAKYGGLFDKADVYFFLIPDPPKFCITTVLYIKSGKKVNLLNSLKNIFEEKVFAHPEWYPKLTSSKHQFGGYPFWLKNGCTVEDAIKPLSLPVNSEFNEEYLMKVTAKITNYEHPKNGSILWDIHVSEIPLENFAKDDSFYYPVVTRFHHSIADGTSLVALLIRLFGDKSTQNYGQELFKKLFKRAPVKQKELNLCEIIESYMTAALKIICFCLDLVFMSLGRIIQSNQLRKNPDVNSLHESNYSACKIAAWATEDRTECIPLINGIKNRANSKFICVVNTAISASMTNYFKTHCSSVPESTSGGISMLLHFPTMDASQPIKLENKTTGVFFDLPTTAKSKTLAEALYKVRMTMNEQIRYTDVLMTRLLMISAGLVPLSCLRNFVGFEHYTFIITNVPGGSKIKLFDGCVLDKIVPICPNLKNIGITFALVSYDDKLNVGVLVDQTLNVTREDVQKIADDILYYIKLLDIDTRKYYGQ